MNRFTAIAIALALAASSCGSDPKQAAEVAPSSLTLVAYDSFSLKPESFDAFTKSTGIAVKIVTAGDAGTMLSKAVLTAGNPEGDVMWGVDNTLLARAEQATVFSPYTSSQLTALQPAAAALVTGNLVTPVDEGDVCVNYDIAWFAQKHLDPPATLDDLIKPEYKDLLVVENPAASSTGLAFMLATVAHSGDNAWQQYWTSLRGNGVKVVDSWDLAYYEQFSGSTGKGDRPLVVSYGTSPPAEVIFANPRPDHATTGVVDSTCFHQVEFAGVLRGTKYPTAAGKLIDYLVSKSFQELLPLTLFVYPARTDAALPAEFKEFAVRPVAPLVVSPGDIEKKSKDWITTWTNLVVR
ncbi:MAG: thiamine ABC transporter substrate-binding protein [Actinomycetota bacterium]